MKLKFTAGKNVAVKAPAHEYERRIFLFTSSSVETFETKQG